MNQIARRAVVVAIRYGSLAHGTKLDFEQSQRCHERLELG
jgi:hypothetical protein